jgi:hypothetical protein
MRDAIDMAREAGFETMITRGETFTFCFDRDGVCTEELKAFEALVRADEQKKWQEQTAVEIYEAVLDEREACAKACESTAPSQINGYECAAAIRARGEASIRSNT